MKNENLENIIYNIVYDSTYDEIPAQKIVNGLVYTLSVFNAEYRIIHAKERMDSMPSIGKEKYYNIIMNRLLASANGSSSYNVEIEKILSKLNEYRCIEESTKNINLVPMTLIGYKIVMERIFCSVERLFCKWDNVLIFEENLNNNIYMEHSTEIIKKFVKEKYRPIGVIGKGDFTKPIKKVFSEHFSYVVI
jgi:hypothetical protein